MSIEPFLQFADRLAEATLLVSGDGLILAANRGVATHLGLDPQRLRRKLLAEVVLEPPDKTAAYLRVCARTSDSVPGALTFPQLGGGTLPCRAEGAVLRPRADDAGALILLRLTPKASAPRRFQELNQQVENLNREIARRRKVEEELLEQRELLRVTLASIGDAVIATDTTGRVIFANPTAQRLTGWTQEEAIGRPLDDVYQTVHETTNRPSASPVRRALNEGDVVTITDPIVLVAREGRRIAIDASAAPIQTTEGEAKGVVLVFHDISDRRRMENELRDRAAKLALADRAKNEFLAMLAHELRNPLAPIFNALRTLSDTTSEPADLPWAMGIMERQVRLMARLVDDLLDVSRITQGKIELRKEHIELDSVLRNAVEVSRPLIESRRQSLHLYSCAEPLPVFADSARLEQVVCNLLNNAAKYTQEGGSIALCSGREGGEIVLRVRDNGLGIAPEMQARVFDLFTQAEPTLDRSEGGLGIGLTLVRTLVELHGGTIIVHSDGLGLGSEFEVRLPMAEVRTPEPGPVQTIGQPAANRRRILLVDDNDDALHTLARLLRRWGHEIHVAGAGLDALNVASKVQPEVILLDIGLPGMDGYEVARRLRQTRGVSESLLIALTGYGQESDRSRSRDAGFDHHLVKPLDPDQLQSLLCRRDTPRGRAEVAC